MSKLMWVLEECTEAVTGPGDVAQGLRAVGACPEEPAWLPVPAWKLTLVCNFSYMESNATFWPLQSAGGILVCRQAPGQNTYTCKIKINEYFLKSRWTLIRVH